MKLQEFYTFTVVIDGQSIVKNVPQGWRLLRVGEMLQPKDHIMFSEEKHADIIPIKYPENHQIALIDGGISAADFAKFASNPGWDPVGIGWPNSPNIKDVFRICRRIVSADYNVLKEPKHQTRLARIAAGLESDPYSDQDPQGLAKRKKWDMQIDGPFVYGPIDNP